MMSCSRTSKFLTFNPRDFNGATAGVEYLVGLSDLFDAGLGVGFYSRSATAVDTFFVQSNGSQHRLTAGAAGRAIHSHVPLSAARPPRCLRAVHRCRRRHLQMAVHGVWRLSPTRRTATSSAALPGSGTAVGPVILGGVRFPVGHKGSGFGFEIKYQNAQGDLPTTQGFAGSKIDLSGFNYLFTINIGLSNR